MIAGMLHLLHFIRHHCLGVITSRELLKHGDLIASEIPILSIDGNVNVETIATFFNEEAFCVNLNLHTFERVSLIHHQTQLLLMTD